VISEALRVQSNAPERSWLARLFGRSPLSPDSRSWYLGAIGEIEVARVLDQLGPGWTVLHAIPVGRAGSDIDHLVMGPGGVYTINSKHHEGKTVWVGAKRLLVNGQRTDHLRNATFEARRVAKLLSAAAGSSVSVVPIIALVAARSITMKERPADVVVLASRRLELWLRSRPVQLSVDELERLRECAIDEATWGSPPLPEPDLAAFAQLREAVASARARRRGWAVALAASVILASLAMPLAAGLLGPALTTLW
jgi:hypothetical protein